jgi:hypothetical protein
MNSSIGRWWPGILEVGGTNPDSYINHGINTCPDADGNHSTWRGVFAVKVSDPLFHLKNLGPQHGLRVRMDTCVPCAGRAQERDSRFKLDAFHSTTPALRHSSVYLLKYPFKHVWKPNLSFVKVSVITLSNWNGAQRRWSRTFCFNVQVRKSKQMSSSSTGCVGWASVELKTLETQLKGCA